MSLENLLALFSIGSGIVLLCWKINTWFLQLGDKVDAGFAKNEAEHQRIFDTIQRNTQMIDEEIRPTIQEHSVRLAMMYRTPPHKSEPTM
jgi:hypothetical protein